MATALSNTPLTENPNPPPWLNRLRWGLAFVLAVLVAGVALTLPDRDVNGLTAEYFYFPDFSGPLNTRTELMAVVSRNDSDLPADQTFSIRWSGYIWLGDGGEARFVVPATLPARLTIGEAVVFDTLAGAPGGGAGGSVAAVSTGAGWQPVVFEVAHADLTAPDYAAALQWATPLGGLMVQPGWLSPVAPSEAAVLPWLNPGLPLAVVGVLLALVLAGVTPHLRFGGWRGWSGLAGVLALALTVRLWYLADLRRAFPHFDGLFDGSDMQRYANSALDVMRGLFPPPGVIGIQPGYPWLLGQVQMLSGPGLLPMQLVQIVSALLVVPVLYLLGRQLFGTAAGWVAAGVWAVFPLAVFYDLQILTHSYELHALVWLAWGWHSALLAIRQRRAAWGWLVFTGVLLGASALVRPTWLTLAPLLAVTVLGAHWRGKWSDLLPGLLQGAALVVFVTTPILPATWYNYQQDGKLTLVSNNAPWVLYIANNRMASGLGENSPAYWATHRRVNMGQTDWVGELAHEIEAEPLRYAQLVARKIAVYHYDIEIPNNVYFDEEGRDIATVLRLPFTVGPLVALALAGAVLGGLRGGSPLWNVGFVSLLHVGLALGTIPFNVFSRYRVPMYGLLMLLAGLAVVELVRRLREPGWRSTAVGSAVLVVSGFVVVVGLPWVAENSIPEPVVQELPATATPLDATFGPEIRLVGRDPLPPVRPEEPLFITLYWQATQAQPKDTYVSVQVYAPNGDKLMQVDQELGTGNGFPIHPAFEWRPGELVRDPVLLFVPADAFERVGRQAGLSVLVVVYDRASGARYGEYTFGGLALTEQPALSLPAQAQTVGAQVGGATLVGYATAIDGRQLTLTLYWQGGAPMAVDATVFVHVLDANGQFVTGQDGRPLGGLYPTLVWQADEGVTDVHTLDLNALPAGEYRLAVGLYDPLTGERLPVTLTDGGQPSDRAVSVGEISLPLLP